MACQNYLSRAPIASGVAATIAVPTLATQTALAGDEVAAEYRVAV